MKGVWSQEGLGQAVMRKENLVQRVGGLEIF